MLSKVRRELARLRDDVNIDTVFNFFVTAYHVQDYLRAEAAGRAKDVDAFSLLVCFSRRLCGSIF